MRIRIGCLAVTFWFLACGPRDRFGGLGSGPESLATKRICRSPVAARAWGDATWDSVTPGGVRTGHVPRPPTVAPAAAATLAGAFDFHVIRTTQYSARSPTFDTLAVASLILRSPPPAFRHPPNHAIEFIAYGWSNIDLRRLGPVSLAYSPADSSADRPGVQVSYNSETETLGFVLGNAFSPTRGMALDAGVYFDVIAVDSTGFRGWWQDGGLSPAKGYFCAWRAQEVWNPLPRA